MYIVKKIKKSISMYAIFDYLRLCYGAVYCSLANVKMYLQSYANGVDGKIVQNEHTAVCNAMWKYRHIAAIFFSFIRKETVMHTYCQNKRLEYNTHMQRIIFMRYNYSTMYIKNVPYQSAILNYYID